MYRPEFWHGGQDGGHLGKINTSRSYDKSLGHEVKKMFIWLFHSLLRAFSMDLLKKKLDLLKKKIRNATGGNTTWEVFKAYVGFILVCISTEQTRGTNLAFCVHKTRARDKMSLLLLSSTLKEKMLLKHCHRRHDNKGGLYLNVSK